MQELEQSHLPEAPYCRVASFIDDGVASFARRWAQEVIDAAGSQLAAFSFPLCSYPHVAIVGVPPPEDLDHCLEGVLSLGEPATIPEQFIEDLERRRAIKIQPWRLTPLSILL